MKSGDSGGILFDWHLAVLEKALVTEVLEAPGVDWTTLLESAVGIVGGILSSVYVSIWTREDRCCQNLPIPCL